MRDLTRERRSPSNGLSATDIVDTVLPSPNMTEPASESPGTTVARPGASTERLEGLAEVLAPHVAAYLDAPRERRLHALAVELIQTAKLLDPITRIAVARCLTLGSLVAAVSLAAWTGWLIFRVINADKGPWPLVACLGVAEALLLPIIWRGQPKAPPEPGR